MNDDNPIVVNGTTTAEENDVCGQNNNNRNTANLQLNSDFLFNIYITKCHNKDISNIKYMMYHIFVLHIMIGNDQNFKK